MNTKKRPRLPKKSIIWKIVLLMSFVALLQALLCTALILGTKVPDTLDDNAYSLFAEKVENRRNYLLSEMLNRWSNIDGFETEFADIYDNLLGQSAALSPEKTVQLLDQSTAVLLRMMQSSMSTGSFIILNDAYTQDISNSGLYIQNTNPSTNNRSMQSESTLMLRGPNDISKKYKIPLSNVWSYGFALEGTQRDILEKPMVAASLTDVQAYQGCWNIVPSFANPDLRILTYSIPLCDQNGQIFAVAGVEISQDYLYKLLPFDDFAQSGSYGYLLVSIDSYSGEVTPLTSQGTVQRSIAAPDQPMILQQDNKTEDYLCYSTETPIGTVSAHYEELRLYDPNTPFSDTQWCLMGLTAKSNITAFANQLDHTLLLMVALSVFAGAIFAFFIGAYSARPIMKLSHDVKNSNFDEPLSFARTDIAEIDELSSAIEHLTRSILDATTKTDQIMDMANVGVGSFEHKRGSEIVIVSNSLQRMLNIAPSTGKIFSVSAEQFFALLDRLKRYPEPEMSDTYRHADGSKRWYKITEMESADGLLGVVLDVSRDVLERYALKYERDYDKLTGLHNRPAFHHRAQQIFATGDLQICAVALFDLDNLKYVNDTYGHELGDLYIKTAARIMDEVLHKIALLGRMAGDEFYVFFHGLSSREEVLDALAQLYQRLEEEPILLPDGTQFKVRMSGGIAWYGEDSKDYNELLRFADFAMYEGKHTIKGELREFKHAAYLAESFLLSGTEELNRVLDNSNVDFAFQPIVNAQTGDLYAYEALMRPQSELLNTPTKLIQIATAQSQLWKVEKITFFKAIEKFHAHPERFGKVKLFLNSVPNQLLKESEYADMERLYADVLPRLVVEVIENERLDAEIMRQKLARFTTWGAQIALDDYGTGYNNDFSLISIHPHIVKLDRFLISSVESDITHQAIVSKILTFCKESGILVLAEGVETSEQMQYLVRAGVDFLQGYYIAHPSLMPDFDSAPLKAELNSMRY